MTTRETTAGASAAPTPEPPEPSLPAETEAELVIDWWADLTCPWCYLGKAGSTAPSRPSPGAASPWSSVRSSWIRACRRRRSRSPRCWPGSSAAPPRRWAASSSASPLWRRPTASPTASTVRWPTPWTSTVSCTWPDLTVPARPSSPRCSALLRRPARPLRTRRSAHVASGLGVPAHEVRATLAGDDYAAAVRGRRSPRASHWGSPGFPSRCWTTGTGSPGRRVSRPTPWRSPARWRTEGDQPRPAGLSPRPSAISRWRSLRSG